MYGSFPYAAGYYAEGAAVTAAPTQAAGGFTTGYVIGPSAITIKDVPTGAASIEDVPDAATTIGDFPAGIIDYLLLNGGLP